jgi:hypothetical protein
MKHIRSQTMSEAFIPLVNSYSRVFLIEGRAHPENEPSFESCLKMEGLDQALGDVTKIECPDPNTPGKFIEIGSFRGSEERATTQLVGRYAIDLRSTLIRLAKLGCPNDVQLHMGNCEDLSDFTAFKKVLILEDVIATNIGTDPLGALGSDEQGNVNETLDISIGTYYEYLPIGFRERGETIITNELIDVVICDSIACGDCEDPSDGCEKIYSVSLQAGGSPGTPPDVVFSIDGGATVYAHDIDSLGAAEDPTGIACVTKYIVVISNDSASLHYALKADFTAVDDPAFTEVATGFAASGEPNDIWSLGTIAFICGDGGYVYKLTDPTAGVTAVEDGSAVTDDLNAIHALSKDFAIAVGNNGAVIYTDGSDIWQETNARPVGVGVELTSVAIRSRDLWWVGTDGGQLYYTKDMGDTWTEKTFPGSGTGVVWDIDIPSDSIVLLSHATATPAGRVLISLSGGEVFYVLPEGAANIPENDRISAVYGCRANPNFFAGVGLDGGGTDGIFLITED